MRALTVTFLATALLSVPAAAHPTVELEILGGASFVLDDGYGLVSDSTVLGRSGLAAWWHPGWMNGALSLRTGYAYGGTTVTSFGTMSTTLDAHTADVTAAWSFLSGPHGRAYARAGVLVDLLRMAVNDDELTLADRTRAFGLVASVGGTAWFGTDESAASHVGVFVEGGWAQRLVSGNLLLTPEISGTPDPARISATPVNAGSLSLSGPFVQGGLVIRL